jgi:hypothetical protein
MHQILQNIEKFNYQISINKKKDDNYLKINKVNNGNNNDTLKSLNIKMIHFYLCKISNI